MLCPEDIEALDTIRKNLGAMSKILSEMIMITDLTPADIYVSACNVGKVPKEDVEVARRVLEKWGITIHTIAPIDDAKKEMYLVDKKD